MLPDVRKKRILQEVQARGSAQVNDLAKLLGVSSMTVRRDLAELDEQGLINRIHGGAEASTTTLEPAFAEKMGLNASEKNAIAAAATTIARAGQAISIAGGTTCLHIAQHLADDTSLANLTIITNSLPVADEFFARSSSHPHPARVLLTGGERTPSDALVGPIAEASLTNLHADILFIGSHSATESGLLTPNLYEAQTNRALIQNAHKVVTVFDGSKWNTAGLARYADWSDIDMVITTRELPADALFFLEQNVNEVLIA